MSETEIVREAMKRLPLLYPGSKWVRVNAGSKGHIKFTSEKLVDIIGVQKFGMAACCEVKTDTGRLEQHQYNMLVDMGKRGALSILYAPAEIYNWDEIPAEHMPREKRTK